MEDQREVLQWLEILQAVAFVYFLLAVHIFIKGIFLGDLAEYMINTQYKMPLPLYGVCVVHYSIISSVTTGIQVSILIILALDTVVVAVKRKECRLWGRLPYVLDSQSSTLL